MAQLLDHPETPEQDVCLPWGCDWSHHCQRNMENCGVVITRYFHPKFTGEHCEFYSKRTQEANNVCQ